MLSAIAAIVQGKTVGFLRRTFWQQPQKVVTGLYRYALEVFLGLGRTDFAACYAAAWDYVVQSVKECCVYKV